MAAAVKVKLDIPKYVAGARVARADLYFHGVDHSWSSFEARVFFNNSKAGPTTRLDKASGYAGSFFVFGHGGCYGDEGHCEVQEKPANEFDRRPPHQLTPTSKFVIVTDALTRILKDPKAGTLEVTVVPVVRASAIASPEHRETVLSIGSVSLLTYE
jgi:hypothetical protein